MTATAAAWTPTAREAGDEAEQRGMSSNEVSGFVFGAKGGSHRGRGSLEWRAAVEAGRIWWEAESIRRTKE